MRKGEFALSKIAGLILILLAALVLILFMYFLRDKITELVGTIKDILRI